MPNRFVALLGATLTVAGATLAGCGGGGDRTVSLAELTDKQLLIMSLFAGGYSIIVASDDCTPLDTAAVQATFAGHPMVIRPVVWGNGATCAALYAELLDPPADDGSTVAIVIEDGSQRVEADLVGYHPRLPVLETPAAEPRLLHRGEPLSVAFKAPAEPPDLASASFIIPALDASNAGCSVPAGVFEDASLALDHVDIQVPATLCVAARRLWVCVGYQTPTLLDACTNAQCSFSPPSGEACDEYPITVASS